MRGLILLAAMAGAVGAQDFSHFEVASVKKSAPVSAGLITPPYAHGGPGSDDPDRITYIGIQMVPLLIQAFGVRSMQMVAPGRAPTERYDISATLPHGATKEQFEQMLRNLLAERFGMKAHHESRELPVYAMTVAKGGPKLKESALGLVPEIPKGTVIGKPDEQGFPVLPPGYKGVVAMPQNGKIRITGQRAGVDQFAGWLEQQLGTPIVDQTGLTGEYDFRIEMQWRFRRDAGPAEASDPAASPEEAAELLGLKLESKKLPFDVIVIDALEKSPTEN